MLTIDVDGKSDSVDLSDVISESLTARIELKGFYVNVPHISSTSSIKYSSRTLTSRQYIEKSTSVVCKLYNVSGSATSQSYSFRKKYTEVSIDDVAGLKIYGSSSLNAEITLSDVNTISCSNTSTYAQDGLFFESIVLSIVGGSFAGVTGNATDGDWILGTTNRIEILPSSIGNVSIETTI